MRPQWRRLAGHHLEVFAVEAALVVFRHVNEERESLFLKHGDRLEMSRHHLKQRHHIVINDIGGGPESGQFLSGRHISSANGLSTC